MVRGLGLAVDVVGLLVAQAWQVARGQAELLAGLVAVADAVPVAEFAPLEVASALTWTSQMATVQLGLARTIVCELPTVHDALSAGDIDLAKAK